MLRPVHSVGSLSVPSGCGLDIPEGDNPLILFLSALQTVSSGVAARGLDG